MSEFIPKLARSPRYGEFILEGNRFWVEEGSLGPEWVHAHGRFGRKEIETANRLKIRSLQLRCIYGFSREFLQRLREVPTLVRLNLKSHQDLDWTPLEGMPELRALTCETSGLPPCPIDFTRLPNLEECAITLHREWESVLLHPSLRSLTVMDSDPWESIDLKRLGKLVEFRAFHIKKLKTVRLAPKVRLESLGIYHCRTFEEVQPFSGLKELKYLELAGIHRFGWLNFPRLKRLRQVRFQGVGKIPTLAGLLGCKDLEEVMLMGSTTVLDGDYTLVERLKRNRTTGN